MTFLGENRTLPPPDQPSTSFWEICLRSHRLRNHHISDQPRTRSGLHFSAKSHLQTSVIPPVALVALEHHSPLEVGHVQEWMLTENLLSPLTAHGSLLIRDLRARDGSLQLPLTFSQKLTLGTRRFTINLLVLSLINPKGTKHLKNFFRIHISTTT